MSLSFSIELNNLNKTRDLGKKIAGFCLGGEIIYLSGDLGAGKTTLVQLVAKELGLKKVPNSPTFVMINEYILPSKLILTHSDLYRINGMTDLNTLGLDELLGAKNRICFVEWPEKVPELENIGHLHIRFIDGRKRLVKLSAKGMKSKKLLKKIGYVYFAD